MKPYNTYKSIVFTFTTAILFFCWGLISQIVQANAFYGVLLGGLISLGTYKIILNLTEVILLKIPFLKRLIFGNTYLEGVWVGCYMGFKDQPRLYIECFEQTFDGLVVRGRCYTLEHQFKGIWVSAKVIIDEEKGQISYTYDTDMVDHNHKNQGLAIFNFCRDDAGHPPKKMIGFSSDIFSSSKIKSIEIKADCTKDTDDKVLLEKASKLFDENKDFFGL